MTEPGRPIDRIELPEDADPPEPGPLKDAEPAADDQDVLDGIGGHPRLTWNSVTDAGGAPAEAPEAAAPPAKSSFHFDLGGALARLAGDDDAPPPPPDPEPIVDRAPRAAPEHTATAPPATASPDLLPTRDEPVIAFDPQPTRDEPDPLPTRDEPVLAFDPLPTRDEPVLAFDPLPTRGAPDPLAARSDRAVAPPVAPVADEPPAEYPRRVPGTHFDSHMRTPEEVVPEIREATPVDSPPARTGAQSVFGDVGPATIGMRGAPSVGGGPSLPTGPAPILPASNPKAPPSVVEAISSAPSTPEIAALRSAQLRASKQQRQGKLFGRSLLAFVLIGGLIAGALFFGRSLLFDTEWDAQLTPVVNDVQAARGAEFARTVPLAVVSVSELGERLRAGTIGDGWVDRVPEWRALGLATGTVDADTVGAALAASTTAIYDPSGDQIYLAEGADPERAALDLRVALERAFDAQLGVEPNSDADAGSLEPGTGSGFVGVSPLEAIATRAVDELLVAGGSVTERQPANESLPFPIAYELAAIDLLGEPLLAAVGADPSQLSLGGPYPDGIAAALADTPRSATSGLIQPGEVSIAPPMALGTDDWSLVWGARLPKTTVDRLVNQVVADSYRPVDRGGVVCVIAVFETANEADGTDVFASMLSWTASAPLASQAIATQLSATRVQLDACDPGADGGSAPNIGVVDALIDRQQLRLTN